jgi:transposase
MEGVLNSAPPTQVLTESAERLAALEAAREELMGQLEQAQKERDEYRRVYLALLEAYRKLEMGLLGQKRERFTGAEPKEQLALALLALLTEGSAASQPEAEPEQKQKVEAHERRKPSGRKPLPEHLPRILVEVLPPEVQQAGLEAFERIGEEVSEVLERRSASLVVVRTVRPKFVPKAKPGERAEQPSSPGTLTQQVQASPPVTPLPLEVSAQLAVAPSEELPPQAAPLPLEVSAHSAVASSEELLPQAAPLPPQASAPLAVASAAALPGTALPLAPQAPAPPAVAHSAVLQAPALELPLPRSLCGPGLLADTLVRRWQDHLPLHRLERIYGREGFELPRSTVGDWHANAARLVEPLIEAMWKDALENSPYLCVDATGVLVQALEKCRHAHFFVVVAPQRHVLYGYQPKHDSDAVDALLKGYKGFLVADAHAVYDHLYASGEVVEVGCWAHARRYWFKSLDTDGTRAQHGLSLIQELFKFEREQAATPPEEKLRLRQKEAQPLVEAFFRYCQEEELKVLDETPIAKAIGYALNQRDALERFLSDGRLPIHNNSSENALRREAVGRKNWLFLGSDEGGTVNATFVTLLASCQLHGLEPLGYLRDLLCLLPGWPVKRVLELAPVHWSTTAQRPEVRAALEANVFRQASLGTLTPTATK